jgi:DNA-binding XRE family transcriptional regulator
MGLRPNFIYFQPLIHLLPSFNVVAMGAGSSKAMRDFLMSRRARLTPEDVGFSDQGRRRVPGLRREEVAELAEVSAEYYVQIERGRLSGISNEVLDRIASALRLCDIERDHFANLARNLREPRTPRPVPRSHSIPRGIQTLMDLSTHTATVVMTPRLDLIGSNQLARALFAPILDRHDPQPNLAQFVFLEERSRSFFTVWEAAADSVVALLLLELGRTPHDKTLVQLVTHLRAHSPEFDCRMTAHVVTANIRDAQRFDHPVVGDLDLQFETLQIPSSGGLVLLNFFAEPTDAAAAKLLQLQRESPKTAWSRLSDLNRRPVLYEGTALPLS